MACSRRSSNLAARVRGRTSAAHADLHRVLNSIAAPARSSLGSSAVAKVLGTSNARCSSRSRVAWAVGIVAQGFHRAKVLALPRPFNRVGRARMVRRR